MSSFSTAPTNNGPPLSSPSLRRSDEQLAQHPAVVVFIISDCVVQFVTDSDLQRMFFEKILNRHQIIISCFEHLLIVGIRLKKIIKVT